MTLRTTLVAAAAVAAASFVDATTTVAVMELGKSGVIRRTTSRQSKTSVAGVSSFWKALHSPTRKLQQAGMTVVPDLFNKADSGLVLGLMGSGVDLDSMPTVSSLLKEEGKQGVVGHFRVEGAKGRALLDRAAPTAKAVDISALSSTNAQSGFHALSVDVDEKNAAKADAEVASLIKSLHKQAVDADTTVVLHLVVEEEEGVSRRRLEDEEEDEEDEAEEEEGDEAYEDEANGNNNGNNQNAYYGYGYFNDNGEWVTPYKTMFQIQYFNIVLWTVIGLTVVLMFTVNLMIYMPLMADTLLFGESAKMMGD